MRHWNISMILSLSILILASSCQQKNGTGTIDKKSKQPEAITDTESMTLLSINASQYGMKYRERQVLLQNRAGVRIEYTLDRAALELWISPQAGKSMSYVDRNWSNRDDHTKIFDRVLIPGCDLSKFIRCDWDPFHSILYFEDQVLHISQVYDQPAVLIWFEKEGGLVDFKLYGEAVERNERTFILNHSDRERHFQSAAVIGEGTGSFRHQTQLDKYRSIHARAELAPNQLLLVSCELEKEKIGQKAKEWVKTPVEQILVNNEEKISKDLSTGQFELNGHQDMQELMKKSRRVALSMQDFKGFTRSTNQYIYYLMWFRDGGMNTPHLAYSGWVEPVNHHANFVLQNPNFTNEHPDSIFYGQMMGGPLTKWQEDGLFYVVWPAFTHWTQTGDRSLIEGENLETMERAMRWLEARCFDEEEGLFGRYFACETPMAGSRDDGYDNVTGAPTFYWGSEHNGKTITRSYDTYVNILHYSTYLMLSAMQTDEQKAEYYYQKAMELEKNIKRFFEYDNVLPTYGFLETEEGNMMTSEPYGMDTWDYVWSLSLPPYEPNMPEKYKQVREKLYQDMVSTKDGYFLCTYFALLTSMDPLVHDEDQLVKAMKKLVPVSRKTGKYLVMQDAVPEMFNKSEEDPFHDVRPLVYSIAPWLSAITNLGIHRLPHGIALRPTDHLKKLENYVFMEGELDVEYKGEGDKVNILFNGEPLEHTWQVPVELVKKGKNNVLVEKVPGNPAKNLLAGSTTRLDAVKSNKNQVVFHIHAYGKNVLIFKNLDKTINITSGEGKETTFESKNVEGLTYVEFKGRGKFEIEISGK